MGKQGLRQVGELSAAKAHYAAERLTQVPGVSLRFARAVLQGVHAASCPRRPTAWSRGSPSERILRRRAAQAVRPRAQGLPAGRGDREAHPGRDRRLRRRAGRGGGVRPPWQPRAAYDKLIFELSSPGPLSPTRCPSATCPTSRPGRARCRAQHLRARRPPRCPRCPSSTSSATTRACQPDELRRRHALLPARLVHDEVQPEDQRGHGAPARLRAPAPAGARGGEPGRARSSCTSCARCSPRSPGMDAVSLQPAAGAQGELAGVLMIRAYHLSRGEQRTKVLIPDSAHGTNPASTALAGYEVVRGEVRRRTARWTSADLERHLDDRRGRVHDHRAQHARPLRAAHPSRSPRCATPRACRCTWTAPTSTRSSASRAPAISASTSATSTCTRRSPRRTAAAGRARGRWASRRTWRRSCRRRSS